MAVRQHTPFCPQSPNPFPHPLGFEELHDRWKAAGALSDHGWLVKHVSREGRIALMDIIIDAGDRDAQTKKLLQQALTSWWHRYGAAEAQPVVA